MIFAGAWRPGGCALIQPTDIKIKALQIQRQLDEPNVSDMYVNWRWSTSLQPEMLLAVQSQGANCVKFANSIIAVRAGAISQATHDTQMKQFLDYTVQLGVYVYWCLHYFVDASGSLPSMATDIASLQLAVEAAKILGTYPNVIGIDLSNESNTEASSLSTATANLAAAYPAVKAVAPHLPLTASIMVHGATGSVTWTDSLSSFAPYCDFWDFHPYYTSGDPSPSDLASFRTNALYKPFLIGECGQGVNEGQAAQVSRWNALGTLSRQTDCYGACGYTTQDTADGGDDYGMYTPGPGTPTLRSWISSAFAAWPSHV